jgi:site-specific recombinase XerD
VSEVTALRLEQIDLQVGYLTVLGKGGKERVVPDRPCGPRGAGGLSRR